jgi:signal transduction histidine kinase
VDERSAILTPVRTERWLRIIGIGTWLIAGSTSIAHYDFARRGFWVWAVSFLAFGAVFWITSDHRVSRTVRVAGLVVQAALAVVCTFIGMPLFEGALLALVAAQVPMVLPLWASVPWAAVQVVPLWIVLEHTYDRIEITKSITSYLGFSAFAIAAVHLFQAEHRARVELDRTVGELRGTRAMLEESTRVAERVRISRELHDVLGHHLAALSIRLDLARRTANEESRGTLDETWTSVKQMLTDVRATVQRLRADDAVNLGRSLRTLFAKTPGIELKLDLPEELMVPDPERAHAAFRCVQEAVTNVLKHAQASRVRIVAKRVADNLEICVEDDGRGTGVLEPGSGLSGMRERIEAVDGTLEITKTPGGGTTVLARIPLRGTK